jgi:CRISPR-associated protein Csx16
MTHTPGRKALTRCFAVTRHAGAAAWIKAQMPDAEVVPHLDPAVVRAGDTVVGTLPVHVAAEIVARGGRFMHLTIDAPPAARGRELTPEEMDRYGARITPFEVRPERLVGALRWPTRERIRNAAGWLRAWPALIVVLLAAFALALGPNLIAAASWDAFVSEAGRTWPRAAAGGAGLLIWIAIAAALYRSRQKILASNIARAPQVPRRPVLVMGLSLLPTDGRRAAAIEMLAYAEQVPLADLLLPAKEMSARREALAATADAALLEAIDKVAAVAANKAFSWQQNLRAVAAQLPELRAVIVLTSPQSKEDFGRFERLLRTVLKRAGHEPIIVSDRDHEADFESYDALDRAFKAAARTAAGWGAGARDLCIDITAGQKIFSIAAVIATLNRGTVFTYVNPAGEVAGYSASIALGEFGG